MLTFNSIVTDSDKLYATLTLPYDQRVKSRQKVELDNGDTAGLFLPRGTILNHGDCLASENGLVIKVVAADEMVSTAYLSDPLTLAKCSYHLGNRHVPLQLDAGFVRYQHDHVLDDMLHQMGVIVTVEKAAFVPENGAYHSHGGHGNSAHTHGTHAHAH